MENDLNKKIELTELDYMNLCAWITNLENRVDALEKELGILNDSPRPRTLAKIRIYDEAPKKETEV